MRPPARKGFRSFAGAAALLATLACGDSGPGGPETLTATIEGPAPLGAALVEVTGGGIEGFEGDSSTEAFAAELAPGVHRVVLIAPAPDLRFRILVSDAEEGAPTARVVSAVGTDNEVITLAAQYTVRIAR